MTSKIRVLSDHTINKIAAGEVIENPSSVVKELVENSIDAGATEISIEIKGGGRQMIRISDNGCGMSADDALLCLERHATSKLREVEDIHAIFTMGFRGEAIPSIASISKFSLLTSPAHHDNKEAQGTMVIVDGGKIVSCTPAARSQGTTIEVKNLFFNVPVRKKFLKSPAYDANEILKMVSIIALGHPHIKFTLINDNKNMLTTSLPTDSSNENRLKERIKDVLGNDFSRHTTWIEQHQDPIKLHGVVGLPSYNRHNRSGQYLFINKRPVISPIIAFAVRDGYGTALPTGRHPTFVLHIDLPGDLIDVNVHPQKREVRLRQESTIKALILQAIKESLYSSSSQRQEPAFQPQISPVFARAFLATDESASSVQPETAAWTFQPKKEPSTSPSRLTPPSEPLISFKRDDAPPPPPSVSPTTSFSLPIQKSIPRVLATIPRYILVDGGIASDLKGGQGNGLMLIDQKAAHKRILFEKVQRTKEQGGMVQQKLLIPHQIELSSFDADILRQALPTLHQLGIDIQEFGPRSFLINAMPQLGNENDTEQLIRNIIHELREMDQKDLSHVLHNERMKRIAITVSRNAISTQKQLSTEEAQHLINQLVTCEQPERCPDGKPTFTHINAETLAKFFHS